MTDDESFLLVSLEEHKAKRLAQVISNDTSRKILDYLTKSSHATESQLSKDLGIPLSTVHYNLKALLEANLIKADEYHYSQKGKEILHYSLTNKLIIIAPKEKKGLREALQKFIPIGIIALGASAIITLLNRTAQGLPKLAAEPLALSVPAGEQAIQRTLDTAVASGGLAPPAGSGVAIWFLFGAVFVLLLFLLFELVVHRTRS